MKLVDQKTGHEVKIGDTVTSFRGEVLYLTNLEEPRHSSSTGRVGVKKPGSNTVFYFFPTVIGCVFVD